MAALRAIQRSCAEFLHVFPAANLEIILIDNNSEENRSEELLSAFPQSFGASLKILRTQNNNMALARNLALNNAQYENLIFVDADCHPDENWLLSYHQLKLKHFKENTVALAGENTPPPQDIWLYNYIRLLKRYPALHLNSAQILASSHPPRSVRHAPTCNILYKRSALLKINGFDNQFRRAGEDLEINSRFVSTGHEILFSGAPKVFHHDPPKLVNWLKKVFHYGKIQPRVLSMYPQHVDKERWLPLALIVIITLGAMIFPFYWLLGVTISIVALLIILGLIKGAGVSCIPWTGFVVSTTISYCLGYVAGTSELLWKSQKAITKQSE